MKTISKQISVGGRKKVTPSEVILLVADCNYTTIHFEDGGRILVATTMKKLQKSFEATNIFFRSHKSFMVNLSFVEQLNETTITMKNQQSILVSRRKMLPLKEKMSEFI